MEWSALTSCRRSAGRQLFSSFQAGCSPSHWAAWCNTWLLIRLTPKGVVCSVLFLLFVLFCSLSARPLGHRVVCWQHQTVSGLMCLSADSCQVPGLRFLHALQLHLTPGSCVDSRFLGWLVLQGNWAVQLRHMARITRQLNKTDHSLVVPKQALCCNQPCRNHRRIAYNYAVQVCACSP